MNWNAYVLRRKIKVEQWLSSRGISTRESFSHALASLGVEPPDEHQLDSMFPTLQMTNVEGVENESGAVTSEGSDQVTTRSVAPEGNGSDLRTNGKRAAKVRGD